MLTDKIKTEMSFDIKTGEPIIVTTIIRKVPVQYITAKFTITKEGEIIY